jgi:hypothetical protein
MSREPPSRRIIYSFFVDGSKQFGSQDTFGAVLTYLTYLTNKNT